MLLTYLVLSYIKKLHILSETRIYLGVDLSQSK